MNTLLTVTAEMKARPGKEAEVRTQLLSLVSPSRKDPGCINYDLHESTEHPGHFLFHENWTSKARLDEHLSKPDLQAVLARVVPMLSEPPRISLWYKVE